jgi:3-methylcrotonyl-CoA carboxylase alpha subunit
MFKKILIANRGEIAVRIMSTCHEMGIRTVAVYSDADAQARHVRVANEAYLIGPAPATESYLNIPRIIDVALRSGAEAIHPGYGFLAENADFAEACTQAGIVFIGPPADAIRLMGSKIAAKQLARQVGAPIVPGYDGEQQNAETLYQEALSIGFPLLIKASAGGGGKGMRVVNTEDEFYEQLAGARREAQAAFGDATVFLERYLQQPRHIEIQILADQHRNVIHLGERECSIQRRHQKILEESPSIALTPDLREQMGTAAVRIASAAGYINAGTIEFIVDQESNFYFLEMNTRLQVEHPVTELITGLDLVRHQLNIAAGQVMALRQADIQPRGHAIEVRIYAEDATQHYLPSTGTITTLDIPQSPGVRLDSGVEQGDAITQYYDPMIAKLIIYGEDRAAAIARLQHVLAQSAIFGVTTNVSLLHAISQHPAFGEGATYTNFLDAQHLTEYAHTTELPDAVLVLGAIISAQPVATRDQHNPWRSLGPWRTIGEAYHTTLSYQNQEQSITLRPKRDTPDTWCIHRDNQPEQVVRVIPGNLQRYILEQSGSRITAHVALASGHIDVALNGRTYRLQRRQPPEITSAAHGHPLHTPQNTLTAPMAGTIVKIYVRDGDIVEAHQVLLVLGAMKMEHAITAPYSGRIQHVHYSEGAVVQGGVVVVEMTSKNEENP